MGFFSNLGAISKINTLLKTIESKVNAIYDELQSPYTNKNKIKNDAHTIAVLLNEIIDIADSAGDSVRYAPYFFLKKKSDLPHIVLIILDIITMCDDL